MNFFPNTDIMALLNSGKCCSTASQDSQYRNRTPRKSADAKWDCKDKNATHFVHNSVFRNESFINNDPTENVDAFNGRNAGNPDD